jgi:hypothetical protein
MDGGISEAVVMFLADGAPSPNSSLLGIINFLMPDSWMTVFRTVEIVGIWCRTLFEARNAIFLTLKNALSQIPSKVAVHFVSLGIPASCRMEISPESGQQP